MKSLIDLRCGDSTQILKSMDDESVDLIVTDPPYKTISGGSGPTSHMHRRPSGMLSKNDGKIFAHNEISFSQYIPDLFRVLRPYSHMYMIINFLNLEEAMAEIRLAGFGIHNLLVWEKNNCTPNRWYMKNIEYVIFARKGKAKAINNKGSKTSHRFNNVTSKTHPTEKPVDLMSHYILNSSGNMDLVFDPFMGTGSSGVAAVQCGRRFIGIEVDKTYFSVAESRILSEIKEDASMSPS